MDKQWWHHQFYSWKPSKSCAEHAPVGSQGSWSLLCGQVHFSSHYTLSIPAVILLFLQHSFCIKHLHYNYRCRQSLKGFMSPCNHFSNLITMSIAKCTLCSCSNRFIISRNNHDLSLLISYPSHPQFPWPTIDFFIITYYYLPEWFYYRSTVYCILTYLVILIYCIFM